ncbi:hypothetical protein B0H10DRAFT_1773360 [Mycena sp. CBHHK59/15]|nr:hypothetical protein B0H10DRAFT_1773360 [Mycena sp. CBHHK59/15]
MQTPTAFKGNNERTLNVGDEFVVKTSWQVDSRKDVESAMYDSVPGQFGTPDVICSYEGLHLTGEPISNHLLLPSDGEMNEAYWDVFVEKDPTSLSVDARTYTVSVLGLIGTSLVCAKSSDALCMALVHALLGWLNFYQWGFMHRDISIGNVLLTKAVVSSKPFAIVETILTAIYPPAKGSSSDVGNLASALKDTHIQESPARETAEEIMALLRKLQVSAEYTAFITDGDMAVNWKTYFDNEHNRETRSGTPEFMSLSLQYAMDQDLRYIQSPIDDIESFFWLALWAVLFNIHQSKRSRLEIGWQKDLDSAQQEFKSSLPRKMKDTNLEECSRISRELLPLLIKWWRYQEDLRDEWNTEVIRSANNDKSSDFYLYHFHLYALRGVRDFLRIVQEWRGSLIQLKPFVD